MKKLLLLLLSVQSFLAFSQSEQIPKKNLNTMTNSDSRKNKKEEDVAKTYIDTTQTIIYNFTTKKYKKSNVRPRVGEPLVFRIININRFAYEANITSEDIAIADEFFKNDIETVLKKNENNNQKNEIVTPKIITDTKLTATALTQKAQTKIENSEPTNKNIKTITENINKNKHLLDSLTIEKQKRIDLITTCTITLEFLRDSTITLDPINKKSTIEQNLNSAINEQKTIQSQIDFLQGENIAKKNDIINITNTIDALQKTFDQLSKMYSEVLYASQNMRNIDEKYQSFYQLALNPVLNYEMYQTYIKDPIFIIYQLPLYRSQINDFGKSINNFYNFYNQAINNWEIFDQIELIEAKDNIRIKYQLYKEEIDKIKMSIDALSLSTKLIKVETTHIILKEKEAYEMVSSPIQPLEDYVTFRIITKHRDPSIEYNDNRDFQYMEYTRGGVRFDFSTGIVINFIGNNDKYELTNIENDPLHKKIIVTDNNQFTPTLAGMFHTSFRASGIWAFGLTLGASINVETFELGSLFPGVSLLIGKKQKFIISAGPAFRQVEELKNNYEENGIYNTADFNADTQLTSKQFKVGFFCGITYNLTQKQRAKFKIGTN